MSRSPTEFQSRRYFVLPRSVISQSQRSCRALLRGRTDGLVAVEHLQAPATNKAAPRHKRSQCWRSNLAEARDRRFRASISFPCSGRRRRQLPPESCRSDARLDKAHTTPTNYVFRASSRSCRDAALFREGARQAWRCRSSPLASISIRGREVAS